MGLLLSIPSLLCGAWQTVICACTVASCCMQANTGINVTASKLLYLILFGISTVLAIILKHTDGHWCEIHNKIPDKNDPYNMVKDAVSKNLFGEPTPSTNDDKYSGRCGGDQAVYRISFGLSIFYLLMLGMGTSHEGAFKGFWGFKILIYTIIVISAFFIPDNIFEDGAFQWIARIASSCFLIIQVLVLIDFSYTINEQMVQNAYDSTDSTIDDGEPTKQHWLVAIIGSSFVLFVSSVVGIVLLYVYYASTCADSQALISISLILVLAATGISLFRRQLVGVEGAILPSAVVSAYAVYLTWESVQSNPNMDCQPSYDSSSLNGADNGSMTTGIFVATLSLMWSCFRATEGTQNLLRGEPETNDKSGGLLQLQEQSYGSNNNNTTQPSSSSSVANNTNDIESNNNNQQENSDMDSTSISIFFFLMFTVSLYMSMVLTNWGDESDDGKHMGTATMWVKICSAWFCLLLYIWTLVAPLVCNGYRDFD